MNYWPFLHRQREEGELGKLDTSTVDIWAIINGARYGIVNPCRYGHVTERWRFAEPDALGGRMGDIVNKLCKSQTRRIL